MRPRDARPSVQELNALRQFLSQHGIALTFTSSHTRGQILGMVRAFLRTLPKGASRAR